MLLAITRVFRRQELAMWPIKKTIALASIPELGSAPGDTRMIPTHVAMRLQTLRITEINTLRQWGISWFSEQIIVSTEHIPNKKMAEGEVNIPN